MTLSVAGGHGYRFVSQIKPLGGLNDLIHIRKRGLQGNLGLGKKEQNSRVAPCESYDGNRHAVNDHFEYPIGRYFIMCVL